MQSIPKNFSWRKMADEGHFDRPKYETEWVVYAGNGIRIPRISETKCVKHIGNWYLLEDDPEARALLLMGIDQECSKARRVNEAGISSPSVEGVFYVPIVHPRGMLEYLVHGLRHPEPLDTPGIVMEYIPGPTLGKLEGSEYSEARRQFMKEIEKAKDLGFEPADHLDLRNAIWHREKQRTYLIDFAHWEVPSD